MYSADRKKFKVEFCTVAHWKNGEITEEKLFYDKILPTQGYRPDVKTAVASARTRAKDEILSVGISSYDS